MTLKFSPDKKRVHCEGCRQFQPVMTQEIDDDLTLVCSACLAPISSKVDDLKAAAEIIKGVLPPVVTRVSLTESGRKALAGSKALPKPRIQTRPGITEGTRQK